MDWVFSLLQKDRQARRFFGAYAQSALGTGAGYVAIVLVAYQRFHSPLAISLILLADIAPPIVLGPLLGAAVDRWSRRWSAIIADATRCLAFGGMALTHSFLATLLLALVAGAGTTLWKPAIMAALPSVVSRERLPSATALYGALTEIGYTVGPALAALILFFSSAPTVLLINAASFGLSALILSTLTFGSRPDQAPEEQAAGGSLFRQAWQGIQVAAHTPAVRIAIVATSSILFFGGLVNVSELLITHQLGAGRTGYALLVTASGIGIGSGSLLGKSGGALPLLERRFLVGLGLCAAGIIGASASPVFAGVVVGVGVSGVGNGMVIVFQRLIIQNSVGEELLGRIFGSQVALDGAAFTISYLAAAALLQALSPREMFAVAGVGGALVALLSGFVLRRDWSRGEHRVVTAEEAGLPPEEPPAVALPAVSVREPR